MIPATDTDIDWASGTWFRPPPAAEEHEGQLIVSVAEGSDFWRTTSYGFVHDDGHALLRPLLPGRAMEVAFAADFGAQFDQAGVFVRGDASQWTKAGIEFVDGAPQLGAVVTHETSDWSAAPVPTWAGGIVTVRVSRVGDAITIRARRGEEDWVFIRLVHWPPDLAAQAGPFCCAPTRAGLRVRFIAWREGPADARLHE